MRKRRSVRIEKHGNHYAIVRHPYGNKEPYVVDTAKTKAVAMKKKKKWLYSKRR